MTKVLRLNLILDLPEGFSGGLREAVDYYLTVREGEGRRLNPRDVSVRVAWEAHAVNRRHGAKIVCEDGIFSLVSGSWRRLDKPPEDALTAKDVWAK